MSKSKEEYIKEKRLRRKEYAELERAFNESLESQHLSIKSQDDFIFGDSALKRPAVAMPAKSNRSATVTSVSTLCKSKLLKYLYYSNEYFFKNKIVYTFRKFYSINHKVLAYRF